MKLRVATGCALSAFAMPCWAGDKPLYQPAPAWITPAPPIDADKVDAAAPATLLFDAQQRIEHDRVWAYIDSATRATSAEMLGQIGTVTIPWMPDKGDLIVHRAEIIRGQQHIDLLKTGDRFSVLRREEGLEQRELTGMLTATMAVQGLQVGDILRVTLSMTAADPALKGRAQTTLPAFADPFRVGFGRSKLSWPVGSDIHWKLQAEGPTPLVRTVGGFNEVTVTMPLPKQAELPGDVPDRYRRLPLLEASSFTDWADVSRTMAPLFATDGLIAAGSPLAAEVAAIAQATSDPTARAERALEIVQDKIRYLAIAMNGGNYVPQTPAQTWELRYGDCKAKTLMLLAMLRSMGIDAEAVLAAAQGGDLLSKRLPAPAAFNHVLVRAQIGGKSLWLDGTGGSARIADIHDTPSFRYVLPLRPAGSALMPVPIQANARPDMEVVIDLDSSAGIDFPSVFKAAIKVRGQPAAMFNTATMQATPKQKTDMIYGIVRQYAPESQIGDSSVSYNAATGEALVTATGVASTGWRRDDKRTRYALDRVVSVIDFQPDRARAAWRDIPVATPGPYSVVYTTRLKLPDQGRGYALEGDQTLSGRLAGLGITRSTSMIDGVVSVNDRVDQVGVEIASQDIAAERAKVATAGTRSLRVVAPIDAPKRWQLAGVGRADGRFKPIDAVFQKAIASAEPDDTSAYVSRASFRKGIFERPGAIEDLTHAIAIDPKPDLYLRRSALYDDVGQPDKALADAEAALKLDPSLDTALNSVAEYQSNRGNLQGAVALVQQRIDEGGKGRFGYMAEKAQLQADGGDTAGGLATLDAAIASKPGDPGLLNARCWLKGTHNLALDTALKDCTKAIELSDQTQDALDSRAMVYFRMNRPDDALADLNAVLEDTPGEVASRFMRAIVYKRMGKLREAEADVTIARLLEPNIDRDYKKYGIMF